MKARLLKAVSLEQLRASIPANIEAYRSNGFDYLEADPSFWFEHSVEVNLEALKALKAPSGGSFYEVENCDILYSALKSLSPYDARDERFWAYLSHTVLLDHARRRWPIPTDDAEAAAHIAKHWFARDKRQVERDQVGSRLGWMGHLCARVEDIDPVPFRRARQPGGAADGIAVGQSIRRDRRTTGTVVQQQADAVRTSRVPAIDDGD